MKQDPRLGPTSDYLHHLLTLDNRTVFSLRLNHNDTRHQMLSSLARVFPINDCLQWSRVPTPRLCLMSNDLQHFLIWPVFPSGDSIVASGRKEMKVQNSGSALLVVIKSCKCLNKRAGYWRGRSLLRQSSIIHILGYTSQASVISFVCYLT